MLLIHYAPSDRRSIPPIVVMTPDGQTAGVINRQWSDDMIDVTAHNYDCRCGQPHNAADLLDIAEAVERIKVWAQPVGGEDSAMVPARVSVAPIIDAPTMAIDLDRSHPLMRQLEQKLAYHGWFVEHLEARSVRITRGANRDCELRMTRCGQRDVWLVERSYFETNQYKIGRKGDFTVVWRCEPWRIDFLRDEAGSRSMCLEDALLSMSRYVADNPRQLTAPAPIKEIL